MDNQNNASQSRLYAGAGKALIIFPEEAFPTKDDNYTGIHDNPHVRILILKTEETQFVLANFELVAINDDVDTFKEYIHQETGVLAENIWICVTHSLATPHMFPLKPDASDAEKISYQCMHDSVKSALEEALSNAVQSIQPAMFGYGTGMCAANVNRVIDTKNGWWLGNNEHGPSDRRVPVYRFDDLNHDPIAILFNYHAQCSVMDGSYTSTGERLVSGDLSGASTTFIEEQYGGNTVAMYCLGAGGDQAPSLKALRTVRGKSGEIELVDVHEQGFLLLEILGEKLGQEVVETAEKIQCKEFKGILKTEHRVFTYNSQFIPNMKDIKPSKKYQYNRTGKIETPVELLQIGNTAIVGVKPEICVATAMEIKKRAPYEALAVMTFVNGGAKYMPKADMYDKITFQSMNSQFVKGTAELFEEDIIDFLNEVKEEEGNG